MRQQSPLPLFTKRTFESTSFDETEALYASQCHPIRIERASREPEFRWRTHYMSVGDVTLSAHEHHPSWRVSSENASDLVYLVLPIGAAPSEAWVGNGYTELAQGKWGAVVQPGIPGRVHHRTGFRSLNMDVKQRDVDRALTTLTGEAPRAPVQFGLQMALAAPPAKALLLLLQGLIADVDHTAFAPRALERLGEALILQLLAAQPHNHSHLLRARSDVDEPTKVRRVAEYLATNLERELRMSELTALTGTSARSIQAGFKKHLGCSPLEFLRARRLDRARSLLRHADSRSIQELARACGFQHAGRFSTYYRARFGETPAQTRRGR